MGANSWFSIAAIRVTSSWRGLLSPPKKRHKKRVLALFVCSLAWTAAASAQQHAIDVKKSVMTVHVFKSGVFSALGHNHEIAAPIAGGTVDLTARQVELHTSARTLQVRDAEVSDKDRAEIQSTMLGPDVLNAEQHPEIVFRSSGVEPMGAGSWMVRGNLTLHGETRPVTVEVRERDAHYVGTSRFKQTDFGMKPVKVAGGTVRVKDEVRIEFDIQLMR